MSKRRPVKVAGTCSAGHYLKRDAGFGVGGKPLLTWRGECPTEGCKAHVYAARVRPGSTAAEPEPDTTPAAPEPPPQRTVRRVSAYRDEPTPARARRPGNRLSPVVSTVPRPTVTPNARDAHEPGPDLDKHEHRRRSFASEPVYDGIY